ncbi:hypothetical protein D3C84_940410 [compost metagenome]
MAVAEMEVPAAPQQIALAIADQFEPAAAFQLPQDLRDEQETIARMGTPCTEPVSLGGDVSRIGKQQAGRFALLHGGACVRGQQRLQMSQDHHMNVVFAEALLCQAFQQPGGMLLNDHLFLPAPGPSAGALRQPQDNPARLHRIPPA